jgi:hypothetical protein
LNQINQQSDFLIEKLRTVADGDQVVSLFDYLNLATIDVIANVKIVYQSEIGLT